MHRPFLRRSGIGSANGRAEYLRSTGIALEEWPAHERKRLSARRWALGSGHGALRASRLLHCGEPPNQIFRETTVAPDASITACLLYCAACCLLRIQRRSRALHHRLQLRRNHRLHCLQMSPTP